MFLAGPKFKNPLASKPASDFRPFDPGIIVIILQIEGDYNEKLSLSHSVWIGSISCMEIPLNF